MRRETERRADGRTKRQAQIESTGELDGLGSARWYKTWSCIDRDLVGRPRCLPCRPAAEAAAAAALADARPPAAALSSEAFGASKFLSLVNPQIRQSGDFHCCSSLFLIVVNVVITPTLYSRRTGTL